MNPRTSSSRRCRAATSLLLASLIGAAGVSGATLPEHPPLRILVVSDEVNPHGLPAALLTQPGEISAALAAPGSGVAIAAGADALLEIATDDLPEATARLAVPIDHPDAYDVLVYFAHRIPAGPDGAAEQAAFDAALEEFLIDGGGVVSFHHGAYLTAGKEAVLALIGGVANGAVTWNTVAGQNVIAVAPAHFVASNELEWAGTIPYADPARGVPADSYPFFNNTPDERYPSFELHPAAGEIELLFGSDYLEAGSTHVLGFSHRRAGWGGLIVAYQPGEYQPTAVDDLDGNNFQILANAIFWSRFHGGVDRLFADGFEIGGTAAWSSVDTP